MFICLGVVYVVFQWSCSCCWCSLLHFLSHYIFVYSLFVIHRHEQKQTQLVNSTIIALFPLYVLMLLLLYVLWSFHIYPQSFRNLLVCVFVSAWENLFVFAVIIMVVMTSSLTPTSFSFSEHIWISCVMEWLCVLLWFDVLFCCVCVCVGWINSFFSKCSKL